VLERKSEASWHEVLSQASLDPASLFTLNQDVDEQQAVALFHASETVLGLTWIELCDAFGHRWCISHAPKIYRSFYRKHKSAREFILGINDMHLRLTAAIPNARPPHFQVAEAGAKSLLVTYTSPRQLIDLAVGLARGIGEYYKEKLSVKKLSASQFLIDFDQP
jgi:hypothetical protein